MVTVDIDEVHNHVEGNYYENRKPKKQIEMNRFLTQTHMRDLSGWLSIFQEKKVNFKV